MNDLSARFGPNHAKPLTELLLALRPDWDRPGTADNLWQARERGNAEQVCIAAIRCATARRADGTPVARTPAVIPQDGNHWREPATTPTQPDRGPFVNITSRCQDCGGLHTPDPTGELCNPPEHARSHGRGATLARAHRPNPKHRATPNPSPHNDNQDTP